MNEKKDRFHRMLAMLLALVMILISVMSGCGNYGTEKETGSELPGDGIFVVADISEIKGSPVALTKKDGEPLGDFSEQLMKNALTKARMDGKENMVLAPVSAYLALMVMACVSEETSYDAYAQVLGIPEEQWNDYGSRLVRHMNWGKEDSCVTAANSLWLNEGVSLPSADLMRISQYLYTKVYQGDLQSKDIVKAINIWVDLQTQGMIPQLRQDPYDDTTVMSILNAVYLEAKWQQAFLHHQTQEKVFYTASGEEVMSEFLQDHYCHRAYVQTEQWDGVMLPYRDGNLVFVALRPTAGQTVDELLLSLEAADWANACQEAVDIFMNFSMPKFMVEYQQVLTDAIAQMGLEAVLQESNIGVGQMVKIQVDEEGTKAAAVTEVTAGGAMLPPEEPPLELHFDQPFVYAVVDTAAQIPLFIGVMDRPVQG